MQRTLDRHEGTMESHALYDLAMAQIDRNRYSDALNHLMGALRIAPRNSLYRSYFGLCLAHAERDFKRAVRICTEALEVLPRDPLLHVNLGKVYKLKGDNRSARERFLIAWDLKKGHGPAAIELARMGIRRPPFIPFLSRNHWANKYLGMVRATLERKLVGHRQS